MPLLNMLGLFEVIFELKDFVMGLFEIFYLMFLKMKIILFLLFINLYLFIFFNFKY